MQKDKERMRKSEGVTEKEEDTHRDTNVWNW